MCGEMDLIFALGHPPKKNIPLVSPYSYLVPMSLHQNILNSNVEFAKDSQDRNVTCSDSFCKCKRKIPNSVTTCAMPGAPENLMNLQRIVEMTLIPTLYR
jgi:hypothetical protein